MDGSRESSSLRLLGGTATPESGYSRAAGRGWHRRPTEQSSFLSERGRIIGPAPLPASGLSLTYSHGRTCVAGTSQTAPCRPQRKGVCFCSRHRTMYAHAFFLLPFSLYNYRLHPDTARSSARTTNKAFEGEKCFVATRSGNC